MSPWRREFLLIIWVHEIQQRKWATPEPRGKTEINVIQPMVAKICFCYTHVPPNFQIFTSFFKIPEIILYHAIMVIIFGFTHWHCLEKTPLKSLHCTEYIAHLAQPMVNIM